ncbi:hypothetical protein E2C01_046372 [Portunus trituberculatus]|uniref:Uncharacterized protein n=1 Tax=Portunus trituberculatus TaxID=210409 RepID=A0A5B7G0S6_PORTR|nr:hypothetical protein [Portunus trituberculatus]
MLISSLHWSQFIKACISLRVVEVRLAAASCTRRVSEAGSEEQRLAVTVSSPSTEEDLDSDQQLQTLMWEIKIVKTMAINLLTSLDLS